MKDKIFHKKKRLQEADAFAEGEGFEPPGRCRPTVFKTAAIDHSANLPLFEGAKL